MEHESFYYHQHLALLHKKANNTALNEVSDNEFPLSKTLNKILFKRNTLLTLADQAFKNQNEDLFFKIYNNHGVNEWNFKSTIPQDQDVVCCTNNCPILAFQVLQVPLSCNQKNPCFLLCKVIDRKRTQKWMWNCLVTYCTFEVVDGPR